MPSKLKKPAPTKKRVMLFAIAGLGALVFGHQFIKPPFSLLAANEKIASTATNDVTLDFIKALNEYNKAPAGREKDQRLQLLKRTVDERKQQLIELADNDPTAFLKAVLPSATRASLPLALQNSVESDAVVTGKLRTIQKDDFSKHQASTAYTLDSNKQSFLLRSTASFPIIPPNSTVKIKGTTIGNRMVISNTEKSASAIQVTAQPDQWLGSTKGNQKTLVLLANFSDDIVQPFTKYQAQHFFFDAPKDKMFVASVNAFYQEASYGKTSFSGDVIDWYTLPYKKTKNNCDDLDKIMTSVMENASSKVNLMGYRHFLVYFPNCGSYGYSDIGDKTVTTPQGTITGTRTWLTWPDSQSNSTFIYQIAVHELGHSLGLRHAHAEDFAPEVINGVASFDGLEYTEVEGVTHGSPEWFGVMYDMIVGPTQGSHIEYGDDYSAMGGCDCARHFSVTQKDNLDWLTSNQIHEVNGSGEFVIEPLESKGKGVKMLKIPRARSTEASKKILDWLINSS